MSPRIWHVPEHRACISGWEKPRLDTAAASQVHHGPIASDAKSVSVSPWPGKGHT